MKIIKNASLASWHLNHLEMRLTASPRHARTEDLSYLNQVLNHCFVDVLWKIRQEIASLWWHFTAYQRKKYRDHTPGGKIKQIFGVHYFYTFDPFPYKYKGHKRRVTLGPIKFLM